ncbi:MAG: histidine phosphatase family protein [Rhodospirillales bacterium]|nr:histidine phosphatase family protein [Rhodospirillales bacterium]
MSRVTRWWWVRHAPVVGVDGIIYGADDVACDVSDAASFRALAKTLPGEAVWVTSHLTRAVKTAKAIAEAGLAFPEPVVERDLAEQSFGDWQGLSWDQMRELDQTSHDAFWQDPTRARPPGGESFADQIRRTARVIERMTTEHEGRDIVAVAHGGTVRAAVAHALGLAPEQGMAITVGTLSVSVLEHVKGGLLRGRGGAWRVVSINRRVG